ncbi:hypothetical protein CSC94_14485 [Zhengella mangrovi]|uniref:Uncharacterized protein n=1 Tax=Zhengella mangrovi TaxID=1982044 RepID=A0A2G1QLV5_9HYPH|nr:hypothetical protein CSC94_14485 [Zhengella mangrovi]
MSARARAGLATALGGEALLERIQADERLGPRLIDLAARLEGMAFAPAAHDRPGTGTAHGRQDADAARCWAADPARFERLCGLVHHGHHLRSSIRKADFERLLRDFTEEDLAVAFRLHHLHGQAGGRAIDMSRLKDLVDAAGRSIVAAWRGTIDPALDHEMALMADAPADGPAGQGPAVPPGRARAIAEAIAADLSARDLT